VSRHRLAIVLGALCLALGVGAIAAASTVVDVSLQINEYWSSGPTAQPGDPEFDRMNALQTVISVLGQAIPWIVLAAAVPGIGALVLAGSATQVAGSVSATAARVASSD
jgi:hypothetical protein